MTNHNSETEPTASVAATDSANTSGAEPTDSHSIPEVPDTAVLPEVDSATADTAQVSSSAAHGFTASVGDTPPVQSPTPVSPYRQGVNMAGVVYACIVMIFAVIGVLIAFRIHFDGTLFAVGACTLVAVLLIIAAFIPNRSSGRG